MFAFVTVIAGFVYGTGQQIIRRSADIRPAELAHEVKIGLERGQTIDQISGTYRSSFEKSLVPFFIVYSKDKKPVGSSAIKENGKTPQIPVGVLENAAKGENRVTWQTESGERYATVTLAYSDGYITGGQSLKEYEKNIDHLGKIALLGGGLLALIGLFPLLIPKRA